MRNGTDSGVTLSLTKHLDTIFRSTSTMSIKTLLSGVHRASANALSTCSNRSLRISRNALLWIAILPFLAVTTSTWAKDLPDFSALIEQEGDAVVKISVVTRESAQRVTPLFRPAAPVSIAAAAPRCRFWQRFHHLRRRLRHYQCACG